MPKRDLPPGTPLPFRKEWQKLVIGEDGKIDRRLWEVIAIGQASNYPSLAPLLGKRTRADVIRAQWGDILRLVGSIKAGHVAPSVMLRKLAAYEGSGERMVENVR